MNYLVEFDLFDPTGDDRSSHKKAGVSHPTGIPAEAFGDFQPWVSYGARTGSRIPNNTGKVVRGIHLKATVTGDKFIATPNAGWSVFPNVWLKNDGTEIIFNTDSGGAGLGNSDFWSRIYPRSPGYDSGSADFQGKVSEQPFPEPDTSLWSLAPKVWAQNTMRTSSQIPVHEFPPNLRQIKTYAESSCGTLMLAEDGTLLFLDKSLKSLHKVLCRHAIPDGINRITVEHANGQDRFTLWMNGNVIAQLDQSPEVTKVNLLRP